MNKTRRNFLRNTTTLALAAPFSKTLSALQVIPEPIVQLNVRDLGALGDGTTKDTLALQHALDRCAVLGGGEVLFPAGNYLTGALQLRSNVLIRLEKDAILTGTPDFADYPITEVRWEGKWIPGHTALLYALDIENSGIVGPGQIKGCDALGGRPTKDSPLRHPALIEPLRCRNLRFEDFSTSYHLMWSIHPAECANLIFKNLTIRSTGGNGDGIDVDSCKHVLIDGCDISTGDDCISLKSGRGEEGYTTGMATEDVTISNCTFAGIYYACIGIGSETSGGIRNVIVKNCKFTAAASHSIYIKSRPGRGPFLENFNAYDLEATGMKQGFLRINMTGSGIQDENPVPGLDGIPTARNLRFSNIKLTDCPALVTATEVNPEKPIDGFIFENVTGTMSPCIMHDPPRRANAPPIDPARSIEGKVCDQGISLANMRNVIIRNVHVTGLTGPLLHMYNVHGIGLEHAVPMDAPKTPGAIPAPATPYKLH